MKRVGVLTGIAAERRIVEATVRDILPTPLIACAGADVGRARRAVEQLLANGAEALVSFGIAGGLAADLPMGALIVADRAIAPDGAAFPTASDWCSRLSRAATDSGLIVRAGTLAGSERIVTTPAAKLALAQATGATAVDMESHVVGRAAAAADVPFLAVRSIADTSEQSLPRSALGSVGPSGRTRIAQVGARIVARPGELPQLMRLGRAATTALAALRRLASAAGPALFACG